jgi:hypothetical protein
MTKLDRLKAGESFYTNGHGNSMILILKSGQVHKLTPAKLDEVLIDDIVYCKVRGHFHTNLVKAKSNKGCLIGNNKGGINGWTKQIFGKVIEIL